VALLPEDPRNQVKLLVAILSVAAGALYFNFIHGPAGLELVELADRVEDLETQNQLAQARVGNLQRLRDDMRDAERELEALERLVPGRAEVPEIYEAIASETQTLNLRLLSIEPLAPTAADSAGTLMRQEWALVVEGGYHALAEFLTNVASFDRIVRPRVSEVVPTGTSAGGRQLVEATFVLETFVLGAGDAATSTETDPPAEEGTDGETRGGLVN
jgi:Tfp pilus assembly protein PilO